MRKTWIVSTFIIFALSITQGIYAFEIPSNYEMAEKMATIDHLRHSASQFQSVLNVIHKYYPEGDGKDSNGGAYFDICFYLTEMHAKVQSVTPDLDLYEFVLGFKNFARDSGADGSLIQVLAVYTASKMNGY